jgi:hypothetical protein
VCIFLDIIYHRRSLVFKQLGLRSWEEVIFLVNSVYFFSEIISARRPLMRAKEKDEENTRIAPPSASVAHNVDQRNSARASRAAMKNYM